MSEYIERYAELAREMATKEERSWRKDELLQIAKNCDVIAHKPPETFWQAVQLCYFVMLLLQIESNGHSVSFGRMDQYLSSWYEKDVEQEKTLSREAAIELLHSCWLKLLEVNKIRSGSHSKSSAGSPMYQNVTIGGQKLVDDVEREDAYQYSAIGCIETAVPGKWGYRCTGMSFINFARVALATLEGGKDATSGVVYLPQEQALSKNNFKSFDEVKAQWDKQIRYYTRKSIEIEYVIDTILEENAHDIICSVLVDDCIERGKTLKQGGAKYDWVSGLQVGLANTTNSFEAVKKLIFDEHIIKQSDLAKALAENFEGSAGEQLRQRLLNNAPKYGNDNDEVDYLLAELYNYYIDELKNYRNPRYGRGPIGGTYYAGTSSISANVPFGAQTAATPDGRKAWTPLAEGASPSSGTDTLGPTAVFNSLGKLPTDKILGGVLLNQKLNPSTLDNPRDKLKLMMMLRTFFEVHKGWHVQYNVVSRDTLLAAKAHPDQYRDLVVRVAGYSAFFTALSPDTQDDIIARTEHVI